MLVQIPGHQIQQIGWSGGYNGNVRVDYIMVELEGQDELLRLKEKHAEILGHLATTRYDLNEMVLRNSRQQQTIEALRKELTELKKRRGKKWRIKNTDSTE